MKRSTFLVASGITSVALGLAAMPVLAQERDKLIDYAGAGLAISDVDGFDEGIALVMNAGNNLRAIPGLAVEGEITTTISEPEAEVGGAKADASYWTVGAYGAYTLPVGQQFAVRGRLGMVYEDIDIDTNVPGGDGGDEQVELSVGLGANFDISNRFAVTADYTRLEEDINHYGVGVRMNF